LIVFPFTQEIALIAVAAGAGFTAITTGGDGETIGAGFTAGITAASCVNLIRMVGEEKVKFLALSVSHPSLSFTNSVATFWAVPSLEVTETVALIGAVVNPG
jgi:hypothetical protein